MDINYFISEKELIKVLMFGFAAILGMTYAYVSKWANSDDLSISLSKYLFGDKRAVVRALSTLGVLCVGAGGLSYLDTLSGFNIFVAGAGIGFLVPGRLENGKI